MTTEQRTKHQTLEEHMAEKFAALPKRSYTEKLRLLQESQDFFNKALAGCTLDEIIAEMHPGRSNPENEE